MFLSAAARDEQAKKRKQREEDDENNLLRVDKAAPRFTVAAHTKTGRERSSATSSQSENVISISLAQFGVQSPDEIRAMAAVGITNHGWLPKHQPAKNGLFICAWARRIEILRARRANRISPQLPWSFRIHRTRRAMLQSTAHDHRLQSAKLRLHELLVVTGCENRRVFTQNSLDS